MQSLREKHSRLQSEHDETVALSSEQCSQLEKLRVDNETFRAQYDKLHKQAQEKLSASAHEYRSVLQKAQEKDATVAQLAAELEQERSRAVQAEELNAQVQLSAAKTAQRLAQLESSSEAARTESVDLKSQLRTLTAQLQETRGRMEEAQQVGQRYKEQILEHREVRALAHARDECAQSG